MDSNTIGIKSETIDLAHTPVIALQNYPEDFQVDLRNTYIQDIVMYQAPMLWLHNCSIKVNGFTLNNSSLDGGQMVRIVKYSDDIKVKV